MTEYVLGPDEHLVWYGSEACIADRTRIRSASSGRELMSLSGKPYISITVRQLRGREPEVRILYEDGRVYTADGEELRPPGPYRHYPPDTLVETPLGTYLYSASHGMLYSLYDDVGYISGAFLGSDAAGMLIFHKVDEMRAFSKMIIKESTEGPYPPMHRFVSLDEHGRAITRVGTRRWYSWDADTVPDRRPLVVSAPEEITRVPKTPVLIYDGRVCMFAGGGLYDLSTGAEVALWPQESPATSAVGTASKQVVAMHEDRTFSSYGGIPFSEPARMSDVVRLYYDNGRIFKQAGAWVNFGWSVANAEYLGTDAENRAIFSAPVPFPSVVGTSHQIWGVPLPPDERILCITEDVAVTARVDGPLLVYRRGPAPAGVGRRLLATLSAMMALGPSDEAARAARVTDLDLVYFS